MSKVRVLCNEHIVNYVAHGLGDDVKDYLPCLGFALYDDNKLIGGVLLNDIRPNRDCWVTIYTQSPHWAKRHVLKYLFTVIFVTIGAKRCSAFISVSNKKSFDCCKRIGFKEEGILREYRENGEDCYVMGMLKKECNWL